METRPALWTLDELCAQAALALVIDYPGQASGRVRDMPDRRMVRYYTTLGLLDRPAAMRGRTALYGRRHLLQLTAIKRLQTAGLSLTEIQARLFGQTDAALQKIARLPELTEELRAQGASANEVPRADAFWKGSPGPATPARSSATESTRALLGVQLADGVTLLLHAARTTDEQDVEALRSAAAPLLQLLRKRRIIADNKDTKPEESP